MSFKNDIKIPEKLDYSGSNKKFDFYGYSACIYGWNIDGVEYSSGEDYLSVKRIKEYKDAGMTIYFPQVAAHVTEETVKNFENSRAKKALDYSKEAGIDKVILRDSRIQELSKPSFGSVEEMTKMINDGTIYDHYNYGLIGKGKRFATEAELDEYIAYCMAPYKDHEAFYGIMLGDEPYFFQAKSYGEVFHSIKRVCPKAYIQYNLLPITGGIVKNRRDLDFPPVENPNNELSEDQLSEKAYEAYIRLFMDSTGAKYLQYDQYPLYAADHISNWYIFGLQIASKICKEYGAEFYFVTQSINADDKKNNNLRVFNDADFRWLNNMLVGFGIKQISYFTYFTKADNNVEHFKDGSCFLTWMGEKTNVYYSMQQIMKEEQAFAPVVLNFDYQTSKVFYKPTPGFDIGHIKNIYSTDDFINIKSVDVDKAVALVTELYDKERDNYLYMVQNIIDPHQNVDDGMQNVVINFNKNYQSALIYVRGNRTVCKIENNSLSIKQLPGDAIYIMPY